MIKNIRLAFFTLVALLLVLSGCKLEEPGVKKTENNLKGETIARYVALGNSLTAGVQSGGLMEDFQYFSFPAQLARHLGIQQFGQPTVSYPGLPNILELDPVTQSLVEAPGTGSPTNLNYPMPYQNLGIPTATTWDILNAKTSSTNFRYYFFGEGNDAVDLVLRNLGTAFAQAKAQQPDMVTLWIGNNDILGYATSGGLKPPTPVDDFISPVTGVSLQGFQSAYMDLADSVASLNAKVAVSNIPDVSNIPFFKVVGPKIAAALSENNIPYPLAYEKGSDDLSTGPATGQATLDNLNNFDVLVTLVGGSYAGDIGKPTGHWYRDLAAMKGVPVSALLATMPVVDTTQAFGLHPQNPWPSALILDAEEIATIKQVTAVYNQIIDGAANAYGFALFDANQFFSEVQSNGILADGFVFSTDFITGGLFSLDGIHPSNAGYTIVANKFIDAFNAKYGLQIAHISVREVLGHQPLKKTRVPDLNVYNLHTMASTLEMVGGRFW